MASGKKPGRPYCEAFPSIRLSKAISRQGAGRSVVQWENEADEVVGNCWVSFCETTAMILEYRLFGTVNNGRCAGSVTVDIERRPQGGYVMACLSCSSRTGRIFLVRENWACRTCHRLIHLSTRVTSTTRKWRERRRLSLQLKAGRPRYMHQRKFSEAAQRLAQLKAELEGIEEPDLHSQLRYEIQEEWLYPEDKRVVHEAPEHGWSPYDGDGFSGPYGFDPDFEHEAAQKEHVPRWGTMKPPADRSKSRKIGPPLLITREDGT